MLEPSAARALGRATVGVMGSGRQAHEHLAQPLGELLARLEVNLLTGAGGGVMTAASRAFVGARSGRGISIGIVPCASLAERNVPRGGSPNAFVELPIYTHLPLSGSDGKHDLSRNHINVLTADVVIALPGGDGTASEVELALEYGKPVAAFAQTPDVLGNLNPNIERLHDLAAVEAFLRRHLALPK